MTKLPRLLIAEDDDNLRDALRDLLTFYANVDVVGMAKNGVDAVTMCHQMMPDIILTDYHMPRLNGLQVIEQVQSIRPNLPIILMSSSLTPKLHRVALAKGAYATVEKSGFGSGLIDIVKKIVQQAASEKR